MLIGYYFYTEYIDRSYHCFMRIYKWSKVGILQSQKDIDLTTTLTDEYGTLFTQTEVRGDGISLDGWVDVIGYNQRKDEFTNEFQYQVDTQGFQLTEH